MHTIYTIGELESFLIAIFVLFIGHSINRHVRVFKKYNIPEPIVGGLVIAAVIAILHVQNITLAFSLSMQNTLMLMFFSTIGLSANYKLLLSGGKKVFIFLGVASVYIIIQNAVGVSLASLLGLEPIMGLIAGSITLSGGHGTGVAWSQTFADNYGINTLEFAMAAATFGLVMGGIIGGPVAQRLISKHNLVSSYGIGRKNHTEHPHLVTYDQLEEDHVTAKTILETLFVLLLCVAGAQWFASWIAQSGVAWLKMPDFVYALFFGVIIANITELTRGYKLHTESIDVIGTVSLSLFLSMALMSLKLWEIFDLAIPLLIILLVQTAVMALFAYFVTFKIMGSNYDAAVITGGHCGFGMGATPTAVMNMGALVSRTGPSPQAFMVVPIVGAFFIDIANLIILQGYLNFMM
ncbi:sodium/glutamate symporter [Shewanella morhuae]|uniref:Sodium/glutamate symporter n=1 Tax=Shewanella morhuae TaxID=365591 RepID=A0A380A363_9GAMM|nr:sodium/glutamate symporter [Shewanella morhuae]PTA50605.1 sodium/glutamate symporter [Shewanella morhuae]GIU09953.1 sodium/glutamate symporter [Shewanella morhuae]SUI73624.1 Glutamate permease [Shewanella morhuae]